MGSMHGSRGQGGQGVGPPLKNYKNKEFLSNTGPDSQENHKATKPAFNVGPSSARQRKLHLMAFLWWADDVPLLGLVGSSVPHKKTNKKNLSEVGPPLKFFLDLRMGGLRHFLTLYMLGNFSCFYCRLLTLSKFNFFKR